MRGAPYLGAHTFCVHRHPVCRTISEYRSLYSKPPHTIGPQNRVPWARWLRKSLDLVRGSQPREAHNLPVAAWYPCDSFLRFETLQADFTALLRRLLPQLPSEATLLPSVSHARPLSLRVTPSDLASIAATFAADFAAFNYSLQSIPCNLSYGPPE